MGRDLSTLRERAVRGLVEFVRLVVVAVQVAVFLAVIALPWLWRLLAAAAPVAAALHAFPHLYRAFGNDPIALLPALAFAILPAAAAITVAAHEEASLWGALVLAAGVAYLMGEVAPMIGPMHVALVVTGLLGFIVLYFLHEHRGHVAGGDGRR